MKLKLYTSQIEDAYVQENMQRIMDYSANQPWLNGEWKFFEVSLGTVTNFRFKHNLGYRPKDIVQTAKTGSATVTFNYDLFTDQFLDITTSGSTVIRFFAGSYRVDNIV